MRLNEADGPRERFVLKPRSGERLEPMAQAVGTPEMKGPAPQGAKEQITGETDELRFIANPAA